MAAPLKVLFYAINGTGLGHLSRLLAIAREQRQILDSLGIASDIQFLTTSDAPEVAFDFPVYKLPSKSVAARNRLNAREFSGRSKLLISNLVAGFRPDLLVLDTVAEGAFREFVLLKDYARHCAFVYRHIDQTTGPRPTHSAHLELYDLVLIPDTLDHAEHYTVPSREDRVIFVGPMHGYDAAECEDRDCLRRAFGVSAEQQLVYVSAGGGGDPAAQTEIDALIDAVLLDQQRVAVVGYGPLFRGRKRYGERIISLSDASVSRIFGALDAAVSAAGYNTYQELLAAQVPSVFYAQEKGWDRQDLRIADGYARGWHRRLASVDVVSIAAELDALAAPQTRAALGDALRNRPTASGHVRGAVELLRLAASEPRQKLDSRALVEAGFARLCWPAVNATHNTAPGAVAQHQAAPAGFAAAWQNARRWHALRSSHAEQVRAEDAAVAAWHRGDDSRERREVEARLRLGSELARWETLTGIGGSDWRALARAFCHPIASAPGVVEADPSTRFQSCMRLLCEKLETSERPAFVHRTLARCKREDLPRYLELQLSEMD